MKPRQVRQPEGFVWFRTSALTSQMDVHCRKTARCFSGKVADQTHLQTQTKPSAFGFQLLLIFSLASISQSGGKLPAYSQKAFPTNTNTRALPMRVSTPLCLISADLMRGNYLSLLALQVLRGK